MEKEMEYGGKDREKREKERANNEAATMRSLDLN